MTESKKQNPIFLIVLIVVAIVAFGIIYWFSYVRSDEVNFNTELKIKNKANIVLDGVIIDNPAQGAEVTSPLFVSGKILGSWFFEATTTILIRDELGKELSKSYITTSDDWMTEDYVTFSGTIEFDIEDNQKATLVIEKANPSDLLENVDEFTMEISLVK